MTSRLVALLALAFGCATAHGQILVSSYSDGQFGEGSVRSINTATGAANTPFVAPFTAPSGSLYTPSSMVVGPDSNVYVASQATNSILTYSPTGQLIGGFSLPSNTETVNGSPTTVQYNPSAIAFGPNGNLYIARFGAVGQLPPPNVGRVDVYTPTGTFVSTLASGLNSPSALLVTGTVATPTVYISQLGDGTNGNVLRSVGGVAPTTFIPYAAQTGGLIGPQGLTIGTDGNLYVADQFAGAVRRYNTVTGTNVDLDQSFVDPTDPTIGNRFPSGVLFNGGNLYVSLLGTTQSGPFNGGLQRYNGLTGAYDSSFTPVNNYLGSSLVVAPVPEPGSLLLIGSATLAGAWLRRRRV